MRLFFILLIIFPIVSEAQTSIFSHIVVGRDMTASGHRLCQDQQFIYFKSRLHCENNYRDYDCDDLKIAPINQIEMINLDSRRTIVRFFNVNIRFSRTDFLGEGLLGEEPVAYDTIELPLCKNRPILESKNIVSPSRMAEEEERPLLEALYRSGIRTINTPYGIIESLRMINGEELSEDDLMVSESNIGSPQCTENGFLSASGEYSGNGILARLNLGELQQASRPLVQRASAVEDDQSVVFDCAESI